MEARKFARNFLSVFMALVLVVGFCPYAAYAAEGAGNSGAPAQTPKSAEQNSATDTTPTDPTDKPTDDPADPSAEEIDVSKVKVKDTSFTYNNKKQSLSLVDVPEALEVTWSGTPSATNAGNYEAVATFSLKEGYAADKYQIVGLDKNQLTVKWSIQPASMKSVAKISSIKTQAYNKGKEVKPAITVKVFNKTLNKNDYTVKYSNNKKVGTATVSVKSKDTKNFTGEAKASFKIQYKLTYKLNGGKNAKNATYYYDGKKTVKLKNPTKKGYTFKGWYTNSKFKGKKVTSVAKVKKASQGNKTLYAKWSKNSYKITYKLNGGKNNSKNPSKYTITSKVKLKNPSRSGYAFQGWYSNKALTKKVTSIAKGSTGKKTLYAKWKKLSAAKAMQAKANSYSSKTKYIMMVNCKTHKVGIYKGKKGSWKNIKYWSCTTGKSSTPTKKGVFTVKAKGKAFGSGYTCWYYTQFYGNYLFHSVLYRPGSQTKIKDGRLGISASHGCVRLSLSNAKWVYKKIPRGTKVVIY